MAYRQKFRKDVIVDYVCYRRWGHNEMDDPSFTQPLVYKEVNSRQSIPNNYVQALKVNENTYIVDSKISKTILSGLASTVFYLYQMIY